MNELEAITTTLENLELTSLIDYVYKAKKEGKQHLEIMPRGNGDRPLYEMRALQFLGFICIDDLGVLGEVITLLPAAMYRYEHEKRNVLAKKLRIAGLKHKELMAIAAFLMSILLLILRVLELAGYKLVFE